MEILKDEAIVLRRKNVNEASQSVTLFTKNSGKVNAIAYGNRKSSKKEKMSLNPMSYIEVEIKKTLDNYVLSAYSMKKPYVKILNSISKLDIAMYILYTLNRVLDYGHSEEAIYERTIKVLGFLENDDASKYKQKEYKYKILNMYLIRLIQDLGIYDNSIKIDNTLKNFERLQKYLSNYLNVNIDYDKMWMGE